jgi:hypothetical protein
VPPSASNESVGVSFPGHFASEFGCRYYFVFAYLRPSLFDVKFFRSATLFVPIVIVLITLITLQRDVIVRKHDTHTQAI